MSVTVSLAPGVNQQIEKLNTTVDRITRQARFVWPNEILMEAGQIMVDSIKEEAPVSENGGELRDSIKFEKKPDSVRVYSDCDHAIYMEEGTKASPGRYVPAIGKRLVSRKKHKGRAGRKTYAQHNLQRRAILAASDARVEASLIKDKRNIKRPPGF